MGPAYKEPLDELLPLLTLFDGLLERSLNLHSFATTTGDENPELTQDDALQLQRELHIPPVYPRYKPSQATELPSSLIVPTSRLGDLKRHFRLSAFDIDVMIIALAPELDRRYEEFYTYLQKDARRIRPSVDLVLNLLCKDAAEKIQRRANFAPESPLISSSLVALTTPSHTPQATLLGHELVLESAVVRYLLAESGLDQEMRAFATLSPTPEDCPHAGLSSREEGWLESLTNPNNDNAQPLRLYLQSLDLANVDYFVQRLAHLSGRAVLRIDLAILLKETNPETWLKKSLRDAWLQHALLHFQSIEALLKETSLSFQRRFWELLSAWVVPIVLSGQRQWQPPSTHFLEIIQLTLPGLPPMEQHHFWQQQIADSSLSVREDTLWTLTQQFQLTTTQIQQAIASAETALQYGFTSQSVEVLLFDAVRSQCSQALGHLAQHIFPRYQWDDLVLPLGQTELLQEICIHVKQRYRVLDEWGFDRKLSLGKGISVLFSGPPGTGKTMAAEVIAKSLQLDLFRIDLSQVVSKYIGETEKNLSQIFAAAANANAILLFDEADSLFGKRTEIKDSHDRFANIEVGYLLQQIEAYEGLAILTTNLRSNLDDAFIRRLRFIIEFPLPSLNERKRIWQRIWPADLPLENDIDWQALAHQLDVTGGSIRNIALSAAFLAADENRKVGLGHIKRAARREYQKMGKLLIDNSSLESL